MEDRTFQCSSKTKLSTEVQNRRMKDSIWELERGSKEINYDDKG